MKRIDITGQKFGRWSVLRLSHITKTGIAHWLCRCECGTERPVHAGSLRYGKTLGCGCLTAELNKMRSTTHGESVNPTKEYRAWEGMKSRCYTHSDMRYYCYGAVGITVCKEWRESFSAFLLHVGRAPSPKHSLDRKDPYGNYEPGNVRWATDVEQANNKKNNICFEYEGETKTLAEWSRHFGINYKMLHKYIKTKGYTFANACEKLKPI
jgi:hypothetical protein